MPKIIIPISSLLKHNSTSFGETHAIFHYWLNIPFVILMFLNDIRHMSWLKLMLYILVDFMYSMGHLKVEVLDIVRFNLL